MILDQLIHVVDEYTGHVRTLSIPCPTPEEIDEAHTWHCQTHGIDLGVAHWQRD